MVIIGQTIYHLGHFAGLNTASFLLRYKLPECDRDVFAFEEFAVSCAEQASWQEIVSLMEAVAKYFLKSRQLSACEIIFQTYGDTKQEIGQRVVWVTPGSTLDVAELEQRFFMQIEAPTPLNSWLGKVGTWIATGNWPKAGAEQGSLK